MSQLSQKQMFLQPTNATIVISTVKAPIIYVMYILHLESEVQAAMFKKQIPLMSQMQATLQYFE